MRKDGVTVDSSPAAAEKSSTLKQKLLDQINACKTIAELDTLAQELSASVGKLFSHERDEVMAAGKKKRNDLSAVDAVVADHSIPATKEMADSVRVSPVATEQPQDAQEMTQEDFISWIECLRLQDSVQGLEELQKTATTKLMSEAQQIAFKDAYEQAKEKLTDTKAEKPSIRKAFKDGAKKASSSAA